MISSILSARWFKISAVVVVIAVGILIGLPFLIQQQARIWLEENGGERVVIRDVDFNPFTAELVLEDLLIEVEDHQPLHFDTARLELEWLPLMKKHIDVQAIELQGFYLLVDNKDILRIGGILLPTAEAEPQAPQATEETSHWLAGINMLALEDFTLVYRDAALDQRVYIDSLELSGLRQWDPQAPAALAYRGAVNEAAVQLEAKMMPFAETPTYEGTISVDKLSLTDFEALAKPALNKLAGLLSVDGSFEVEMDGEDIRVRQAGTLEIEAITIGQEKMALNNQSLGWDGDIELTFNTASSHTRVKSEGRLKVEDTEVEDEQQKLANQLLAWDGTADVALDTEAGKTQVNAKGELKIEDSKAEQGALKLANQLLAWDGTAEVRLDTQAGNTQVNSEGELRIKESNIEQGADRLANQLLIWAGTTRLALDSASSQTLVNTKGKLSVEDTTAEHAMGLLSSKSLTWEGVTDLALNDTAAQTSVNSEGKLSSADLSTRLQERPLKLEYQKLDVDLLFSYADSEPQAKLLLNSELLVSGLNLFAPEKQIDIVSARKLQLAGLEVEGPAKVSVREITADSLDLGRSLQQQEIAVEDEQRGLFHVEKLLITEFSNIDGFTAVDTIVEEDAHAVYHRDKEGKWNVVTLLEALAAEDKPAADSEDGDGDKETGEEPNEVAGEKAKQQAPTDDSSPAADAPPPIAVRRIDISKGSSLTIYDEHVTPPFKTTLTINELFLENLDGRNHDQAATIKLDGRFDKHASIKATGEIKPYLQPAEMNIQGKLEAIGLPPLSPYTTDSMGVMIDSGSLDADLKLVSKDQLMKGEAVLLMHQLSVKGTDSKDGLQSAIPVPLDMALNILRDKNDTIKLKIPIEGDANNPDFDVTDAITTAVAKGVSAGATSYLVYALQPYGAMVAVAKVAGEQASKIRLDPIVFEPGQANLDDSDRDYLSKIAKVLKERPKIAVKVCGVAVQQDIAHIQPPPAKTTEQSGDKAAPGSKTAPPAAPPPVDEQKLTALGEQRAASVRDYLVENFKIPANRLTGCQTRLQTDRADAKPRTDLLL
jgi:outer membrane protein OmpA-like peptidoglycan-associated protein